MKIFVSLDIFVGLLERGRFVIESVVFSFLIMRTILVRLIVKFSVFNNFKILVG